MVAQASLHALESSALQCSSVAVLKASQGRCAAHMMEHFLSFLGGMASNRACRRLAMALKPGRLSECGSQHASTSCFSSGGTALPTLQQDVQGGKSQPSALSE